jgi:uncharacterized protein YecE (DUF72 family)
MNSLHVGTMGWSYAIWKGNFYPEGLAANEFLAYYAKHFSTVEVDSTFYRIPKTQSVMDWKAQTPADFVFSLKFPRVITHVKMLKNCEEETNVFLERVVLLEEKLAALLLQFPYPFGTKQVPLLRDFLPTLPNKHRYVLEVRNRKLLSHDFYSVLRDYNVALAWADSPFMPQISEVTSDFIYVRWIGNRRRVKGTLGKIEVDRKTQIDAWAEKLKPFLEEGTEVFGYFSKHYSGHSPSDAKELLDIIGTDR